MYLTHEWQSLTGKVADVMLHGQPYRRGWVDAAMPDGSGFWLAADGVNTREFLEITSGYQVWTNQYPRVCTVNTGKDSRDMGLNAAACPPESERNEN